jgi:hypothetical protein
LFVCITAFPFRHHPLPLGDPATSPVASSAPKMISKAVFTAALALAAGLACYGMPGKGKQLPRHPPSAPLEHIVPGPRAILPSSRSEARQTTIPRESAVDQWDPAQAHQHRDAALRTEGDSKGKAPASSAAPSSPHKKTRTDAGRKGAVRRSLSSSAASSTARAPRDGQSTRAWSATDSPAPAHAQGVDGRRPPRRDANADQ